MRTEEPCRIDRRTAEQLLGPAPMGICDGHRPLAALLTAAAVPGRPAELASEQASLAAFRTAQLIPTPQPGRLPVIKTVVMKVLTVKALAIVAATACGGVALAASTGTLHNPLAQPAPTVSSGLSEAHPAATPSRGTHNPGGSAEASKSAKGPVASKAPPPSLAGLCHAYSAGNKTEHGKALDNPAFTALITTAGGKDKVDQFCQSLLAVQTSANSHVQPSGAADKDNPTDRTARLGASPKR